MISVQSKGLSRVFSNTTVLWCSPILWSMTTGKSIAVTIQTFVSKVTSQLYQLYNTPLQFVIAFLPRSSCLLISWLQSPSAVILEPKNRTSVTTSIFSPSICHAVMGLDDVILGFLLLSFKPALSLSHSPSSRGSLVPLFFLPLEWYHPHI